MRIETARSAAAEWVMKFASDESWFRGAYFSGSTVSMPDDAVLPVGSDVDVVIVTALDDPPLKLGKFTYQDTLIEVTYLAWNQLMSVDEVLSSYHLAGSFRTDTIIADPTGHLSKLLKLVSLHFAEKVWIRRRCEDARNRIENGLRGFDDSLPWHDQVTNWLFPAGVTTHVLLVAALRNPTVRLRYLAAREVLTEYGYEDVYAKLLILLGCADMSAECVMEHLSALERTFDAAAAVAKTPFFFSSDITMEARSIAIDGSREQIRNGNHREVVFWIVATFVRCHKILAVDGSAELQRELNPYFDAVLRDLGITSSDDLLRRSKEVLEFLPRLWETAERIIEANPLLIK
ncbi:hypothetical protein [Fictibacillus barbaricus]|uniref:Polymerase nucleotidyl transferase domain-containing protein n=1 Tax=Fictibacillus barbaricus TaxID=182136 RepID=A0ABU1U243_9BACL|nr:hypothetical protein [Fictibacillus barbaricus]MDR7073483.1 hypothetical protein [Fictibacillus barbaricus]